MFEEEMYYEILRVVEEVTGVSAAEMFSSNYLDYVDARYILVYVLHRRGFSDNRISRLTGLTRPCVCMIRNSFKYRLRRYFVNLNYETVCERVFGKSNAVVTESVRR